MRRRTAPGVLVGAAVVALTVAGCAAPYDDDGEAGARFAPADLSAVPAAHADAAPVVVDTDLGGDDLVALVYLLREPAVRVEAVTIAATGLVGCDPGVDLVADLVAAVGAAAVPVACGRPDAGPGGRTLPEEWRRLAATGSGLRRAPGTAEAVPQPAHELIGDLSDEVDGLTVLALGPLTNVADLAQDRPDSYRRLAGVHAMAGGIDVEAVDGVAEWNAAADPSALAAVLAGPVPVTVVPDDAIPAGTPAALASPVVGDIAATVDYPQWWDLSTAAAFVVPEAASIETGEWVVDGSGRLSRSGPGRVRVVRALDASELDAAYEAVFR